MSLSGLFVKQAVNLACFRQILGSVANERKQVMNHLAAEQMSTVGLDKMIDFVQEGSKAALSVAAQVARVEYDDGNHTAIEKMGAAENYVYEGLYALLGAWGERAAVLPPWQPQTDQDQKELENLPTLLWLLQGSIYLDDVERDSPNCPQ